MTLRSWLKNLRNLLSSRKTRQTFQRRPRVEPLEDRTLLTISTPLLGASNDVRFDGDAAMDAITFSVAGGLLQHNLGGLFGFTSNTDLDSVTPGNQTRAVSVITSLTFADTVPNDIVTFSGDPNLVGGTLSVTAATIDIGGDITAASVTFSGNVVLQGSTRLNSLGSGSDGSLDPTFGGDGQVTTNVSGIDQANAVIVLPGGKILAVGYSDSSFRGALARYNSDGTLDTSFGGGDGLVTTSYNGALFSGVALQDDGMIVAIGNFGKNWLVTRFTSGGTPDPTFGNGGPVITSFDESGGSDQAYCVTIQPNGKILVAGMAAGGQPWSDFALARYNSNGTLDPTFDGDGKVTTNVGGVAAEAVNSILLQPDGKIVAAGTSGLAFAIIRYNSDGTLDASFDGDGIVTTKITPGPPHQSADGANGAVLQDDGKFVLAGAANITVNPTFALARYNSDGTLDASFGGGDGIVTTNLPGGDQARDVLLQRDGRIVAIGLTALSATNRDFALARYQGDGTLDPTFGVGGIVTTSFPEGEPNEAFAAALKDDGRIVVAGRTGADFALAQYAGLGVGLANFTSSATLNFDLNGTMPGTQYEQLTVEGTVNLSGAQLALTLGFAPAVGNTFTIIDNNETDPVVGTFMVGSTPLLEGSTFATAGVQFAITYTGGTGNDVVLTVVNTNGPPTVAADLAVVAVDEGGVAANTGTFSDPQGNGTVTLTASVGAITQDNTTGTWSWIFPTNDGPDQSQIVTITAIDDQGAIATTTFDLIVNNVAPTASVAGPNDGVRGQPRTFTLFADDPSPVDQAVSFTFAIDWTSDGSVDETIIGPSGTQISHEFFTTGPKTVGVTARDKDGAIGAPFTHHLTIGAVQIQGNNLAVGGTTTNDSINVIGKPSGPILVMINNTPTLVNHPALDDNTIVLIYALGGRDNVHVVGQLETWIWAGAGEDTIAGGSNRDIIFGGAGDDLILGRAGDDVLVGGHGRDTISGASGRDIVVGGEFKTGFVARNGTAEYSAQTLRDISLAYVMMGLLEEDLRDGLADDIDDTETDRFTGGRSRDWFMGQVGDFLADLDDDDDDQRTLP